ncbi:MAG: hypothetical protein JXA54_06035 [Candidatus Heimdallarchaeota archaeon]|nr:hypothetical protein [Candidatus Heimdallarchaeota archaeon]
MNIFCKNRINIQFSSSQLNLDPHTMNQPTSYSFISHAHTDHLPVSKKKPSFSPLTICSKATARLFYERMGYHIDQKDLLRHDDFTVTAVPGGHTFDSTVAEIIDQSTEQTIVYTGDVNIEDRGYLKGYKPKKCDVLILEATWGDKHYQFPSFKDQIDKARNYIQSQIDEGYPVAILGYPLGKAQLLNYSLGDICEIRYSGKSVWAMEQVHKELGLPLYDTNILPENFTEVSNSLNQPWLLFYTHRGANDPTLSKLKQKFNLKIAGFSGWAKDEEVYKHRMGVDAAFTISDHSDYSCLLKLVEKANPKKIFTVFGNAHELARDLQKEGYYATPLKESQATLDNFF